MTTETAINEYAQIVPDYFYRVHISIKDEDEAQFAFDFLDINEAATFAKKAFISADYCKVSIEFLVNEIGTTQSPMIRDLCAPEYTYKNKLNQEYGKKVSKYQDTDSVKDESSCMYDLFDTHL